MQQLGRAVLQPMQKIKPVLRLNVVQHQEVETKLFSSQVLNRLLAANSFMFRMLSVSNVVSLILLNWKTAYTVTGKSTAQNPPNQQLNFYCREQRQCGKMMARHSKT